MLLLVFALLASVPASASIFTDASRYSYTCDDYFLNFPLSQCYNKFTRLLEAWCEARGTTVNTERGLDEKLIAMKQCCRFKCSLTKLDSFCVSPFAFKRKPENPEYQHRKFPPPKSSKLELPEYGFPAALQEQSEIDEHALEELRMIEKHTMNDHEHTFPDPVISSYNGPTSGFTLKRNIG